MHDQACEKEKEILNAKSKAGAGMLEGEPAQRHPLSTTGNKSFSCRRRVSGARRWAFALETTAGRACPERVSEEMSLSPLQLWVQTETAALETHRCKLVFTNLRNFS